MTSLRIILALCLLSLFAAYAQADSPTYRVSVLAYANGSFDPVATDLITTSLSNQNELIVVERAELEILITEKTLEHLQSKVSRRAAQILGIDFFVFLEKASEETLATVRIVDASNSSLIGSKELLWNEENLLQAAETLAPWISKITAGTSRPAIAVARTIAFIPPEQGVGDSLGQNLYGPFVSELERETLARGWPVLHRTRVAELVNEKSFLEAGLRDRNSKLTPFQGAEVIVHAKVSEEKLFIAVQNSRSGERIAAREIQLTYDKPSPFLASKTVDWLLTEVSNSFLARHSADSASTGPATDLHLRPESFSSFYRGVSQFAAGEFLEAVEAFWETEFYFPNFGLTRRWMKESYRQAGFVELAEAVERCLPALESTHSENSLHSAIYLSTAVIGTNTGQGIQAAVQLRLASLLASAQQGPVVVESDLLPLLAEYDSLVGLKSVTGVDWQNAKSRLFQTVISATFVGEAEKHGVLLTRFDQLLPTVARQEFVSLANGLDSTVDRMTAAVKRLLSESPTQPSKLYQPDVENQTELAKQQREQLEREIAFHPQYLVRDSRYLALLQNEAWHYRFLSLFPTQTVSERNAACMRFGLLNWFIAHAPKKERPWLTFLRANWLRQNADLERRWESSYKSELQLLRETYPEHVAAKLAAINLLQLDNTIAESQRTERLADLKRELQEAKSDRVSSSLLASIEEDSRFSIGAYLPEPSQTRSSRVIPILMQIDPSTLLGLKTTPTRELEPHSAASCKLLSAGWTDEKKRVLATQGPEQLFKLYLPQVSPCRTLLVGRKSSPRAQQEFFEMALAFWLGEKWSMAHSLFDEFRKVYIETELIVDPEVAANALYRLAKLEQRYKNNNAALQHAKAALSLADSSQFQLLGAIDQRETAALLQSRLSDLVVELRRSHVRADPSDG